MPIMKILSMSELKGRLIAYIGGAGVSLSSEKTQTLQKINESSNVSDILTWVILPGLSLGSLLTIVGAAVVVCRFAFDVWSYFDQRRIKRGKK